MKIEKNIPIPEREVKHPYYMWHRFGVGDSIFLPTEKRYRGASAKADEHGRRYGKKFTARIVDDGVRIWRTK